eukprot:m.51911 g.51911  ORF g.51911 m.51911 type:complete len:787 (-) comp21518_c0_seq1:23-2383(-)
MASHASNFVFVSFLATTIGANQLWVSPIGDDMNSGGFSDPFRTVAKAAQSADDQPTTINLASGTYDSFSLVDASDVTVKGAVDGPPSIISGGLEVPPHLFTVNRALSDAATGPNASLTWTLTIALDKQDCAVYGCGDVTCAGNVSDQFRITKVAAGSPEDPRGGICKNFQVQTQNIIEQSVDGGVTFSSHMARANCGVFSHEPTNPPGALDCGNALQVIGNLKFNGPITVYSANLSSLNIPLSSFGAIVAGDCIHGCSAMPSGLSFGADHMVRARWPNLNSGRNTYTYASTGCGAGCFNVPQTNLSKRIEKWGQEPNGWIHGYFEWDWADCYRSIASVTTNTTTNILQIDVLPATESPKPNARFYGLNLKSELDFPGEFYLELTNFSQVLHMVPPVSVRGHPSTWAQGPVIAINDTVVDMSNTSGVTMQDVHVMHGKGVGIRGTNVSRLTLSNCTSTHHGQQGVYVTEATDSSIVDCTVSNTGCAAIRAHGGEATSLLKGNLQDAISTFSLWKRTYQAGIHWSGVSNHFIDNVVTNGPHNCFLGGGNEADQTIAAVDNVFQGNVLEDCAFEAADTGAFYVCGQSGTAYVNRNNTILQNMFHHVRNTVPTGVQTASVQAIYLDDQMSGWTIENNSFIDCQVGSFVGGGRRNIIVGNYYEGCDVAQHIDNRGQNWENSAAKCSEVGIPFNCTCNPGAALWMISEAPAHAEWLSRFPFLADALSDRPGLPYGNVIANNTYCNCGTFIDADESTTLRWDSTVVNNTEVKTCTSDVITSGLVVIALEQKHY